jgi:hypothetical protein
MFTVDVAATALFPALVCKPPMAMVFTAAPAVEDVTFTMIVQPPAGMLVPLASVKLFAAEVAVTPVHVPVLPPVPMVIPAGKLSVKIDVSVIALAFVLPMVTVKLVLPPLAKFGTAKALLIVGAANTVNVAPAVPPVSNTGPAAVTAVVVFTAAPTVEDVTLACN